MCRLPPRYTRTATLVPYTTLFRSATATAVPRATCGRSLLASRKGEQEIACFAGLAGGAKDLLVIIAKCREPRRDIIRMANGRRDTERCTGERRRHLRDKLLLRIGVRSKPADLVAVQPTDVSSPMATRDVERRVGEGSVR